MKKLLYLAGIIFCLSACSPIDNENNLTYFTVTFDSRGGSEVESQRVLEGNPVVEPDPPTLDGYYFSGWYVNTNFIAENRWNFDVNRVTQNLTLFANWTEIADEEPTEGLVFELNEDRSGYILRDYEGSTSRIIIPEEYEGLPVTEIQGRNGTGALARTNISSIKIPDSIEIIGQNSFYNCSLLERFEISQNSHLIEIGNNAFSGCGSLLSLYIPEGVTEIGDSAFNNCGEINEFIVDERNEAFRSENGHLIDRNTNTIIRGANNSTIPNGIEIIGEASFRRSQINELYIPLTVNEIGNYFMADSNIERINYEGNELEWDQITKGRLWNLDKEDILINYSFSID